MKKRTIVITMCTLFLGIGLLGATQATAQTVDLKFAHFMSPKHIQHVKSFEPFCHLLTLKWKPTRLRACIL